LDELEQAAATTARPTIMITRSLFIADIVSRAGGPAPVGRFAGWARAARDYSQCR
jgi:hypothetical protein